MDDHRDRFETWLQAAPDGRARIQGGIERTRRQAEAIRRDAGRRLEGGAADASTHLAATRERVSPGVAAARRQAKKVVAAARDAVRR